jgi:phenylalanyl-tRNA synthetase beta chain
MRPTLMVGMLNSILWNINRRNKDLALFELGNIYYKGKEASEFEERSSLCVGMTGQASSGWVGGSRAATFYDLKGIIEPLLYALGIEGITFKDAKNEFFSPAASASIEIGGEHIGTLGEVEPAILDSFDIKTKVYLLEVCVDSLVKHARLEKRFKELPKYPSSVRDISLVVDTSLSNAHILSVIRKAGGALLKDAALIDRYAGKQIPQGKASLTYRLEYQDPTRTLEDKDIASAHAGILAELEQKCGAKLRDTK